MTAITLTVAPEKFDLAYTLLARFKASELSDLRRSQTQLSVYGDRRVSLAGEPAAIQARMELLEDLLTQLKAQRPG